MGCSGRPTYRAAGSNEVVVGCLLQPMGWQHMSITGRSGHAMIGS